MMLITLILLLSSGAPASKAYFECSDIMGTLMGDDNATPSSAPFVVDSRGAVIFTIDRPRLIHCVAYKNGEIYKGPIKLGPEKVTKIYLEAQWDE